VRSLKTRKGGNLAPGSIRRLLPDGYSVYSEQEAVEVRKLGLEPKEDVQRDRRLAPGEEDRIVATLAGERRADRERALTLPDGEAMLVLYQLIMGAGVRLREAYTVRRGRVDLERRVVQVRQSKMWRGRVKLRAVPLRPDLHALLSDWLDAQAQAMNVDDNTPIFPFWNGDESAEVLTKVSRNLSSRFSTVFAYAECEDLTEHDLRHEATCRWFEERDRRGGWLYRPEEIHRIMGWAPGSSMAQRYASFRAEDLAERLWPAAKSRKRA
jgi:integrase